MPDFARDMPAPAAGTVELTAPEIAGIFLVLASPRAHEETANRLASLLDGTATVARAAGPEKWLVVVPEASAAADLRDRLAREVGPDASMLDQSDGRVLIAADGPDAREMLAKGTGMDIDPSAFPLGASAMTAFGHVTIHLTHRDADGYDLIVMSSFAGALWEALLEGAREFGCQAPATLPGQF